MRDNSKTENILWKLNDLIEDADSKIQDAWQEAYDAVGVVLDELKEHLALAKDEKEFITEDAWDKLIDIESEIDTVEGDFDSFQASGNFDALTFEYEEMCHQWATVKVDWKLDKYGLPKPSHVEAALAEFFSNNAMSIFDYEINEEVE